MNKEKTQPDYTIDDYIDRFCYEHKDLIDKLYAKESEVRSKLPEAQWSLQIETLNKYNDTINIKKKDRKEPVMTTPMHDYHCPSSNQESHYYLDTSQHLNKMRDYQDSDISLYDGRSTKSIINFVKVYGQAILSKDNDQGMVMKRIPLDDCFKLIFAKIESQLSLAMDRSEQLKTQFESIEIRMILACNNGKRESVQLSALLVLLLLRIRFLVEKADFKKYINDWIFSQEREDAMFKERIEKFKEEQKRIVQEQLEQQQQKEQLEQQQQEEQMTMID